MLTTSLFPLETILPEINLLLSLVLAALCDWPTALLAIFHFSVPT